MGLSRTVFWDWSRRGGRGIATIAPCTMPKLKCAHSHETNLAFQTLFLLGSRKTKCQVYGKTCQRSHLFRKMCLRGFTSVVNPNTTGSKDRTERSFVLVPKLNNHYYCHSTVNINVEFMFCFSQSILGCTFVYSSISSSDMFYLQYLPIILCHSSANSVPG